MSRWGEATDRIVNVLTKLGPPLLADEPRQLAEVEELAADGVDFRRFWQGRAHGEPPPAVVASLLEYRELWFRWRDYAGHKADWLSAYVHRTQGQSEAEAIDSALVTGMVTTINQMQRNLDAVFGSHDPKGR